jgi:hypothetical protein
MICNDLAVNLPRSKYLINHLPSKFAVSQKASFALHRFSKKIAEVVRDKKASAPWNFQSGWL